MPAITDLKKETRKSIILNELANPNGEKDFRGIAAKYKWDWNWTKDVVAELEQELEHINGFNRAVLTIKTAPRALEQVDSALSPVYDEPDHKLRAGELGLRTLKALDPKLRTQQIDLKHSGNVLLTISQANSKDSQAVEAMFEVVDTIKSSEG